MTAVVSILARLRATPGLWKWLPLILVLVPAIYLTVILVRNLRARRAAKAGPARPRLHLAGVWRTFVRRTPAGQRRALALFQPFILLGEAGAGKSALVDRFIDWRGHALQFQPSHVDDAPLQIYRGANALVQELSAALLEDSSPEARTALRQLWRLSVCGRAPEVVIALDAARLMRATPEQLTRRAQVIRGKLDLLAELLGRPVDVTLVVTKADQLSGYQSLATLLQPRSRALLVHPAATGTPDLEAAFARFEEQLPVLLASAPADAYLKALLFFDKLPSLLQPLDSFVRVLRSAASVAPAPIVRSVALDSNEAPTGQGWNPFAATLTEADVRRFRPLRKHSLMAAAAAAAAALYLLAGFATARARIESGGQRLEALLDAPGDDGARSAWLGALAEGGGASRQLLPGFFAADERFGEAELRRRFVTGVRQRLLEPLVTAAAHDPQSGKRLYALSLLRASNVDRLGRLIVAHAAQWGQGTNVPAWLVRDYVEASTPSLLPPLDAHELNQPIALETSLDTPDLSRLVAELQRRVSQPSMSPVELRQLAELAAPARRDAIALMQRQNLAAAVALMTEETGVEPSSVWPRLDPTAAASAATPEAVAALTALVDKAQLDNEDAAALDLAGLVTRLSALATHKPPTDPAITLTLGGQSATIDPAAWDRLLTRSRAALLARAFASRADDGTPALFADAAAYAPITVTTRGDGCSFDGVGRIEGVYTARAVAEHLVPALTQLPDLITRLPLDQAEKEQLSDRIVELVGGYADEYGEQYRALVTSLRCKARSPSEVRWLTTQLPAASSPLRAALREVARNSALTLPHDNPFSAPLESVSDEFAALRALAPPTGPATQLDGWVALLRGMQATLDGRSAPAPDKDKDRDPDNGLRARLTPIGRLALTIYRGDEDSPKLQLERWLTAANLDTDWWPPFATPVEAAYALGRRELQTTLAAAWDELSQRQLQPLGETFPFRRDVETPATPVQLDALAPKQAFWSAFEAAIAPVLIEGRDGWRAREGRTSPLLPRELLPTIDRLGELEALLWDKEGKPKPIIVRLRPLPLLPVGRGRSDAPAVVASYLTIGGNTVYGFNQRADWATVKIEWWRAESAAVGVAVGTADAGKSYRAVSVMDQPWSFWRLLLRASSDGGRIFTWQVPGPDDRPLPVQFELKEEPWNRFALR